MSWRAYTCPHCKSNHNVEDYRLYCFACERPFELPAADQIAEDARLARKLLINAYYSEISSERETLLKQALVHALLAHVAAGIK